MSDFLWPHGLQHPRLLCPPLSPGVCSNSCPLSRWCHLTISSSVASFSSCPQSFPTSGSFPMSWLFTSGSQSIGVSASASVLPKNIQDWFLLGLTGLISLLFKRLSRVFFSTTVRKHQFFGAQLSLWSIFECLVCASPQVSGWEYNEESKNKNKQDRPCLWSCLVKSSCLYLPRLSAPPQLRNFSGFCLGFPSLHYVMETFPRQ